MQISHAHCHVIGWATSFANEI